MIIFVFDIFIFIFILGVQAMQAVNKGLVLFNINAWNLKYF